MPGQEGNAAIAGHRTTYGAPFYNLDELQPDDPILVTTLQGSFRYEVMETNIVRPSQVDVLENTDDNRLTLTTCHPRFSASAAHGRHRQTRGQRAAGAAAGPQRCGDPGNRDDEDPKRACPATIAPRGPAVMWGAGFAAVWALAYAIRRRFGHKWIVWPVALVPMGLTLFFFFENFARLLPANV